MAGARRRHAGDHAKTAKAKPKKETKAAAAPRRPSPPPRPSARAGRHDRQARARPPGPLLIAQGNYAAAIDPLAARSRTAPSRPPTPAPTRCTTSATRCGSPAVPAEAIPVLQQRLQNPDQRGAVQQELELAEAAVNGGETAPGKGNGKDKGGHGKGHGKD